MIDKFSKSNSSKSALERAWDLAENGNLKDALSIVECEIKAEPQNPLPITIKGMFLREASRLEEAEKELKIALRIDPGHPAAWGQLGLIWRERGFYQKAAFCFQQLVEKVKDHSAFTLLADSQLAFDPQAALSSAKQALQYKPDFDEALEILRLAQESLESKKKGTLFLPSTNES